MAMDDIRIVTSSGNELSFRGGLVAFAVSDRLESPEGERWFDLKVYKLEVRRFVPVIEFHSTCEREENVTIAEIVDKGKDVENFYFVFEPTALFDQLAIRAMPAEASKQLTRSVFKLYDSLVNRVLLSVKEHTHDESASASQIEPDRGKRIFGFLGPK
jgi:hypothetical protein